MKEPEKVEVTYGQSLRSVAHALLLSLIIIGVMLFLWVTYPPAH